MFVCFRSRQAQSYDLLRNLIPPCDVKTDKANLLEVTVEYVSYLRSALGPKMDMINKVVVSKLLYANFLLGIIVWTLHISKTITWIIILIPFVGFSGRVQKKEKSYTIRYNVYFNILIFTALICQLIWKYVY